MNEEKVISIDLLNEMRFFTPTPELKELAILQQIENNEDTTQKQIGQAINAAPSMINVYINDYEEKGYIIREYISSKTVKYRITPKGIKRKNLLLIQYLHELLKLYRLAKENVEEFLDKLVDKGYKDILLYGAGEVAETILGVIRDKEDLNINVVAIIDDDIELQNKEIMGYKIIAREDINNYKHHAIVITSYTYEEDIRNRLEEIAYDEDYIIRIFS